MRIKLKRERKKTRVESENRHIFGTYSWYKRRESEGKGLYNLTRKRGEKFGVKGSIDLQYAVYIYLYREEAIGEEGKRGRREEGAVSLLGIYNPMISFCTLVKPIL